MSEKRKLLKLLNSGETETMEFKEKPNEDFFKTISAFANSKGGSIILGVSSDKKITGIDKSDKFLEDLTNRIVNKLSLYPDINTIDIDDKRALIIKVLRSSYPVSYEGKYYERVGNTTRQMSSKKLQEFMQSRISWDTMGGDFSLNEIDEDTVRRFVQLAVDNKRLTDISVKERVKLVLQKLGLLVGNKLTNGAILLFGKDPQKYFINRCVRIGRFKKDEITIIDDKWVKGNLFNQFEETINIIRQHISVRYEIKNFQRADIWDYPIPAIREAVLNALVHRDYFEANFTLIKVYDDHIWFHNPGGLPEGITIDQLKKPHSSVFRNPQIAKIFYLAGFIEQYGSGTVRMVHWIKEAGLPEPEYKEEMGGFSVYFYKDIYMEENLRKMGLNERQIRAVMYVKEKGKITNKEYQELTNVSKAMATIDLKGLVSAKIFEKKGTTGKGTEYSLIKASKGIKGLING